jgi:acyl carrier protein
MSTVDKGLSRRLQDLLLEKLHIEVDDPATDLLEVGLIDSLVFVDLLLLLESECGVSVAVEELEIDDFRSIDRIAAFIDRRNGLTD